MSGVKYVGCSQELNLYGLGQRTYYRKLQPERRVQLTAMREATKVMSMVVTSKTRSMGHRTQHGVQTQRDPTTTSRYGAGRGETSGSLG